jgi:hypothetical protein
MQSYAQHLRKFPLFGGLIDCGLKDHWEATSQILITLILSTTPIWLATLLLDAMTDGAGYPAMKSAFLSTIANGELFMYCTALLAPMFWIALDDPPGAGAFRHPTDQAPHTCKLRRDQETTSLPSEVPS